MQIVEVKQNWPDNYFKIDLAVGNICNYKCWYCFPGSNEGNYKWPDFDSYVAHLSYILDYYKEHTGKNKFLFNLLGGEVTHWKRFVDFIKYFKEKYNCVFSMHTNASKSLQWWEQAAPYLDVVSISHHQQFSDKLHNRQVADYLYSQNVVVNVQVLMDPTMWDQCVDAVSYYKGSTNWWTVRLAEVLHDTVNYTPEQVEVLSTLRARGTNPIFFLRNNKTPRSKVKVVDSNSKSHKIEDHKIILDRINNFKGWSCNLGVDWLSISADGKVGGVCNNPIFNQATQYNIFDANFIEKFQPTIVPTICQADGCWCQFDVNMPKKK